MPLTLTLSLQTGRGDWSGAAYPFSPQAGRRCRQADEGQRKRTTSPHPNQTDSDARGDDYARPQKHLQSGDPRKPLSARSLGGARQSLCGGSGGRQRL
ncbi:hypothetical protein CN116_30330 [Sinorhizobium meliloti]|nr:hypothetical protein DA101_010385 [Sinorhizobium meliloti]RVM13440.1 hypothetical protein CN125_00170 [Sinorhizobium meliloti]RVM52157.1 hypothetical protein CN121_02335 [Sinorhizobium meliloti]RVM63798.1 hypothetical protein CN124_19140 [Sinorhizobium meliloti]RVM66457.1 hypothetical protein CN123_17845 [Sinorhizobium meliloti]